MIAVIIRLHVVTPAEMAKALGFDITTFNVLLGVVVGAVLSFVPQTINLMYDAYQRRKERQLVVKRDVLLKAAEGAAGMADALASYATRRTNGSEALRAAPGWMYKVHVVGSDATVKAFMEAHDCANEAIAELELLTFRIGELENRRDAISQWRKQMDEYHTKLASDPKYMELLPNREQAKFDILNKIMGTFSEQGEILENERKQHRQLVRRAIYWLEQYDSFVTKAMLQARRELTFGGESKFYRKTLEQSAARSKAALEALLSELLKEDPPTDEIESTDSSGSATARETHEPLLAEMPPEKRKDPTP